MILPSKDKLALYGEWLERIDRLKTIERSELKALNGTLNLGSFAIEGARLQLRPSYRAASARYATSLSLTRDMIPLSNHLKARFRWTRQAFKVTGGAALVENYSWYGAESPQTLA